ncbi:MAG: hypothetical protein ACP5D7_01075 [Limnospira sp.]
MKSKSDRNFKGFGQPPNVRPDLTGRGRPSQQTDTSSYLWQNPSDRRNDPQFPHRQH